LQKRAGFDAPLSPREKFAAKKSSFLAELIKKALDISIIIGIIVLAGIDRLETKNEPE